MKIRTIRQAQLLRDAVDACSGHVSLVDSLTGREYNLKNKDVLSRAVAMLMQDHNESLELFATRREDLQIMMNLMAQLAHDNRRIAEEQAAAAIHKYPRKRTKKTVRPTLAGWPAV